MSTQRSYGCGADSGGVPDVRLGAGEDSGDGEIWMNDVDGFFEVVFTFWDVRGELMRWDIDWDAHIFG